MTAGRSFLQRPSLIAFLVGAVGGAALIATHVATRKGEPFVLTTAAMMLAVAIYLRTKAVTSYRSRFNASLLTFLVANLITYLYVATINGRTPFVPLWPIAAMLAIGIAVGGLTALISRPRPAS